jgi:WD40 repeat protein
MVVSLAFAPDGERLASGSADRTVRVWDLRKRQGDSLVLDNQRAVAEPVVFAHDGQHLAIGGGFAIRVWNLHQPNVRPVVLTDQSVKGVVADVAFAPDDRRLAAASADDNVRVWDLREPQAPPILWPDTKEKPHPWFSPLTAIVSQPEVLMTRSAFGIFVSLKRRPLF